MIQGIEAMSVYLWCLVRELKSELPILAPFTHLGKGSILSTKCWGQQARVLFPHWLCWRSSLRGTAGTFPELWVLLGEQLSSLIPGFSHSSRYHTLGCNLYQSQVALLTWKLWNHSTFKLLLSFSTPRGVWDADGCSFALCSSARDPPWHQAQHCRCTDDLCRHHPAMPLPSNRAYKTPCNSSD